MRDQAVTVARRLALTLWLCLVVAAVSRHALVWDARSISEGVALVVLVMLVALA